MEFLKKFFQKVPLPDIFKKGAKKQEQTVINTIPSLELLSAIYPDRIITGAEYVADLLLKIDYADPEKDDDDETKYHYFVVNIYVLVFDLCKKWAADKKFILEGEIGFYRLLSGKENESFVCYCCDSNNPLGRIYAKTELDSVLRACERIIYLQKQATKTL